MDRSESSCPRCGSPGPAGGFPVGACAACLYAVVESEEPTLPDRRVAEIDSIPTTSIAGFRLLDVLGEGGGGRVYLAEQPPPLPRVVALKLFAGVATREALARFDDEKRALGRLEHPGIARIYQTGKADDGRPFIVMEYVEGEPITAFCDARGLGLDARLRLIVTVCETVEAAHRRGVLHRDLKPSNILVRMTDAGAAPVVIDFGLAKFREGGSELSLDGRIIGTPLYMSPEQARADHDAVDTRTDVHAIGSLLYELLVGLPPFAKGDETDDDIDVVLHRVRQDEAVRPSAHLAAELALDMAGPRRDAYLKEALPACRKELDWVVLRALEKDPERRYPSPSELAAELTRHMTDQPVIARPPTTTYRVGKYVRRHRIGVAATAVIVLALIAGIVGTSIGLVRAIRAEQHATEEAERATREARTAKRVSDFLVGVFKLSDPNEARGNSVTAREVLDRGVAEMGALGEEPRVQARLVDTMGRVYRNLGLYAAATPLIESGLRTREGLVPPDEIEVLQSLDSLGNLQRDWGRLDEAEATFARTLVMRERILGGDHPDVATSLSNLAAIAHDQGEPAEAKRLNERALAIRETRLPPDNLDLATTRMNLGLVLSDLGEADRAKALLEAAVATFEARSPDSLDLAMSLDGLSVVLAEADQLDRAMPMARRGLALREKILGPDHPEFTPALVNVSLMHLQGKDYPDAEPGFRRAIVILEKASVPDHRTVAMARAALSVVLVETRRLDEGRQEFDRAIAILTKLGGPDSTDIADVYKERVDALRFVGRAQEADDLADREAAMRERIAAKDAGEGGH